MNDYRDISNVTHNFHVMKPMKNKLLFALYKKWKDKWKLKKIYKIMGGQESPIHPFWFRAFLSEDIYELVELAGRIIPS